MGTTYSLNDGEGGFRVAKVVMVETDVVFVNLFNKRWKVRPKTVEVGANRNPAPVAFSPDTFSGMQPVLVKDGSVVPEEAETYQVWKTSNSGVL